MDISEDHRGGIAQADDSSTYPGYRVLAFLAFALSLLAFVDGLIPQLQMRLFAGHILVTNAILGFVILLALMLGCFIHPSIEFARLPMFTWLLCIAFLLFHMPYLILAHDMSLKDVLASYSTYYLLLLSGPAALAFRGAISERVIIRCTGILLLACAMVGIAQYLTGRPLLYTESVDGKFQIYSWNFFDDVRAFSLFTSGLGFGLFCSLCGALGIALFRKSPIRGASWFVLSALACLSTLTRLCYLVFLCASAYALVLVFGKRALRGLWQPILFFVLAIATILSGLRVSVNDAASNLQDSGSLLMRLDAWSYYLDIFSRSSLIDKLFGGGIILNKDNVIPIDNVPLALLLHVGLVGLVLFGVLLTKMWLYLRREALITQQPFIIAAASLWATLACAGIFNIVLIQLGGVFAITIFCKTNRLHDYEPPGVGTSAQVLVP